ncbi:MAG: GGDEF domain-containing phosphodiesterase [Eubacterium sp.]|nr:GGDEF domain-containing phosphodiesterase [Eubacterium sp.]
MKYRLLHRAFKLDEVSGGNNKREFERVASELLAEGGAHAAVCANIDRFKIINDVYGEDEGNRILRTVQSIINDELSKDEVSGRIMADNFGMVVRYISIPMLDFRLKKINDELAKLTNEKGESYGLTMYYGVYIFGQEDDNINIAMERAHFALASPLPSFMVPMGIYNKEESQMFNREKELEMKMRDALQRGEFVPYLQPKYELQGETVEGAEALVRWISPEGMIYPGEFIPLFEKNGFVVQLDHYMFEEVCKMQEKWFKEGYDLVPVSVNLSRCHLEINDFFSEYRSILSRYELPPRCIEIELTESLFFDNMEALNDLVSEIHEAGMTCSIDDFGSGYSSLNMLKDVKVDALKLDRVFFQGENNERGRHIVRSVLHLAQDLDLRTISEGVEEREQVSYLKEMNCDLIQGYVFAKPMPVDEFEKCAYKNRAKKSAKIEHLVPIDEYDAPIAGQG